MKQLSIAHRPPWSVLSLLLSLVVMPIDEDVLRAQARRPRALADAARASTEGSSDVATLRALNERYVRSVQASDVRWFSETLADDFVCSLADGSVIDRETFLKNIAAPATVSSLQAHDVQVRPMGDFAIVHARTTFKMADGRPGASRYTDVWVRRDGRWLVVAAHVTRY